MTNFSGSLLLLPLFLLTFSSSSLLPFSTSSSSSSFSSSCSFSSSSSSCYSLFTFVSADFYVYEDVCIGKEEYNVGGVYEMYSPAEAPPSIWSSASIQPHNPSLSDSSATTASELPQSLSSKQLVSIHKFRSLQFKTTATDAAPDTDTSIETAEAAATATGGGDATGSATATATATPTHIDSYISMNLTFRTKSDQPISSFIEVHVLQTIDLKSIGGPHGLCCTFDDIDLKLCQEEGTLIINNREELAAWSTKVYFRDTTAASFSGPDAVYPIRQTGEHVVLISNCDAQSLDDGICVNGITEWMNPYGYLSGKLYGYLPFYAIMSFIYLVVGFVWFVLSFRYWDEVAAVQHCISAVIAMCLFECTVWFAAYKNWNDTGYRHMAVIIIAILLTVIRLSISRMLVVSVALGWGTVHSSLDKNTPKLILLGILYFLFESTLEIAARYAHQYPIAEKWRVGLAPPVFVLNCIFFWWSLISLHRLLAYLDARKQSAKLAIIMYRKFTFVLVLSLLIALLYAIYHVYFTATRQQFLHWSSLWLLDQGTPFIIYSAGIFAIAFLWRPPNSKAYAYSEVEPSGNGGDILPGEENDKFREIEMRSLTEVGGDGRGGSEMQDDGDGGSEDEEEVMVNGGVESLFAIGGEGEREGEGEVEGG